MGEPMDDRRLSDLIARSRGGDLDAFGEIVRALHGEVRGFAAMLSVAPDWIDDVAQEVFIEAHRALERYDESRSFRKWLRGIARNVIRRYAERQSRESKLRQGAVGEMLRRRAEEAVEEVDVHREGALEALRECLGRLPESLQKMVKLRYTSGKTSGEIARIVDRKAEAVRMTMVRTRRKLLECIRAAMHGPEVST